MSGIRNVSLPNRLTSREKIYRYMLQRLREGDPPTIREVQKAMGFKAVESARSHLESLVAEGRLVKREGGSRSYGLPERVRSSQGMGRVPILGQVQAGALTYASQEVEGFLKVDADRQTQELFALRVRGDSMKNAGLLEGDLVLVRRQKSADHGDIVVALIDDEATVKRLYFEFFPEKKIRVFLKPENPDFESREVEGDELKVLGKVIEVRRYYESEHS